MDIQRPASVARQKKMRRIWMAAAAVLALGLVSVALARLKPAAPTVEASTVWRDTVKRGPMVRQVRGLGTLVPVDEARRWLASSTQGRVERIVLRPGAQVTPDTVILELNDPQLQQQLLEAETQLRGVGSRPRRHARPPRHRAPQPAVDCRHGRSRLRAGPARARGQRGPGQGRPGLEPDPQAVHGAVGVAAHPVAARKGARRGLGGERAGPAPGPAGPRRSAPHPATTCAASRSTSCGCAPA